MIPLKLSLRNFLSYGENLITLDFTKFHIACLSGNNGHGKSALLDALTWVIWGEARKGLSQKKPEQGLLHIGAKEILVEYEFNLEKEKYRIIRQYQNQKTSLEFQIYNSKLNHFVSISKDSSLTKTQQKIMQVLRMDYFTFINSTFILQGKADEFTKKNARERKNILADILGLAHYDTLSQLSREAYKELEKEAITLKNNTEEITKELVNKPYYEETIKNFNCNLTQINKEIKEKEKNTENLKLKKNSLLNKKENFKDLVIQEEQLTEEIKNISSQIDILKRQKEEYQKCISEKEKILLKFSSFQELEKKEEEFAKKIHILRNLETEFNTLQEIIQNKIYKKELEKKIFETKLIEKIKIKEKLEEIIKKEKEIMQGYNKYLELKNLDDELEQKRNQSEKLNIQKQKLEENIRKIKLHFELDLINLKKTKEENNIKIAKKEEIESNLNKIKQEISFLQEKEKNKDEKIEQKNKIIILREELKNKLKKIEQETDELNIKLTLLKHNLSFQCPLCETNLDSKKQSLLQEKLELSFKKYQKESEEIKLEIESYLNKEKILSKNLEEIQKYLKNKQIIEKKYTDIYVIYHNILLTEKESENLTKKISQITNILNTSDYATEERTFLKEIENKIINLNYNKEKHFEIKNLTKQYEKFNELKIKYTEASISFKENEEEITLLKEKIEKLNQQIFNKDYLQEEYKQSFCLQDKIKKIDYDEKTHKMIREELEILKDIPLKKKDIEFSEKKLPEILKNLQDLEENKQIKQKNIFSLKALKQEIIQELTELPQIENEIIKEENLILDLKSKQQYLFQQLGIYQNKYENCKKKEKEKKELENRLEKVVFEKNIYEKLTFVFGKDGIQASIIENAIPEIEEEANQILSKLTNGKAKIYIEPLKDLKTGGIKETLDIKIGDELGIRDYELFSGGENFRTNFALRIALSKLLAKRAGTKLRFLVIDEGFGSQDKEGLENLVSVIQSISSDFDKILIITHLDTLKDIFPVKIEVAKSADKGSVLNLSHNFYF